LERLDWAAAERDSGWSLLSLKRLQKAPKLGHFGSKEHRFWQKTGQNGRFAVTN
jgi:hypothetical protein